MIIEMYKFEIVSLDMFQTLVNVDSRIEQIWKPILMRAYTHTTANENARLLLDYFMDHWMQLRETSQFFLLKEVYERSFSSVFQDKNITYAIKEANQILLEEHTRSAFYDDTVEFLDRISKKYITCIISDADEAMLPRFYEEYGIHMFNSEQYHSYKNDENNTMFKQLLKSYNADPSKVIHIGDSFSDVAGAKREGITACWLNRDKKTWEYELKPDFEIESLRDLDDIL